MAVNQYQVHRESVRGVAKLVSANHYVRLSCDQVLYLSFNLLIAFSFVYSN